MRTIVPAESALNRGCFLNFRTHLAILCVLCGVMAAQAPAQSTAALGYGLSAAAAGRGGAMVAEQGDPLDAVEGNPAGLAGVHIPLLDLGATGMLAAGSFKNSVDNNGQLSGVAGAIPYAAFASPLGASRWVAALAFTPDMLMRADWHYIDPPGTAGASYGLQKNESKIVALRSSVGLARTIGPKWAVGATLGLVYNTNTLVAPYIFQQQPKLAGLKVLLALNTSGFGWNGSAGVQWRPRTDLRVGAAWKSGTDVTSHGTASGSAYAQFDALGIAADPAFHYRAEVDNHLPQAAAVGVDWQENRRLRWELEGDWTDWGQAFRQLPVKLTQGTNQVINSVAGGSAIEDAVPLHWRDTGALHLGVVVPVTEKATVRAGYAYMSDPVTSATLTPLTAAILRNSLAAGAGEARGRWRLDVAYQVQLPASRSVGQSALLAGEYDDSRLSVMTQSLTITTRIAF